MRDSVRVKLVKDGDETYVLARSEGRRDKEQGMRRRRLRKLIKRLRQLKGQALTRDAALAQARRGEERGWQGLWIADDQNAGEGQAGHASNLPILARPQEVARGAAARGRLSAALQHRPDDPRHFWSLYLHLVEIEQVFKELKSDLYRTSSTANALQSSSSPTGHPEQRLIVSSPSLIRAQAQQRGGIRATRLRQRAVKAQCEGELST